jgi:hypothetical protein
MDCSLIRGFSWALRRSDGVGPDSLARWDPLREPCPEHRTAKIVEIREDQMTGSLSEVQSTRISVRPNSF